MSKKPLHQIALPTNRVFRIGPFALAFDPGQALIHGGLMFVTSLSADHHNADGELIGHYDFGSGLITVTMVNTLVSDAVTGSSVVPTLARFKYMDSGTSSTAATDGDTALNAPCQTTGGIARPTATLSNNQTATTGNHAAILKYVGTITYPASYAVTEWGLFDAKQHDDAQPAVRGTPLALASRTTEAPFLCPSSYPPQSGEARPTSTTHAPSSDVRLVRARLCNGAEQVAIHRQLPRRTPMTGPPPAIQGVVTRTIHSKSVDE